MDQLIFELLDWLSTKCEIFPVLDIIHVISTLKVLHKCH